MVQDAIFVDELVKSYDGKKLAVDHLSFNVSKGEIYGLLGRNGAGKSTTIKILTTLIGFDSGIAEVLGLEFQSTAQKSGGELA